MPSNKQWLIYAIIAVVAIVILFAVIIPGFRGYAVAKQLKKAGVDNIDELAAQNEQLKTEIAKAQADSAAAQAALSAKQQELAAAQSASSAQISELQTTMKALQEEIDTRGSDLAKKDDEIAQQEKVLASTANRLCCIASFTNNGITGYIISKDSVACTAEGGTTIMCS